MSALTQKKMGVFFSRPLRSSSIVVLILHLNHLSASSSPLTISENLVRDIAMTSNSSRCPYASAVSLVFFSASVKESAAVRYSSVMAFVMPSSVVPM